MIQCWDVQREAGREAVCFEQAWRGWNEKEVSRISQGSEERGQEVNELEKQNEDSLEEGKSDGWWCYLWITTVKSELS